MRFQFFNFIFQDFLKTDLEISDIDLKGMVVIYTKKLKKNYCIKKKFFHEYNDFLCVHINNTILTQIEQYPNISLIT